MRSYGPRRRVVVLRRAWAGQRQDPASDEMVHARRRDRDRRAAVAQEPRGTRARRRACAILGIRRWPDVHRPRILDRCRLAMTPECVWKVDTTLGEGPLW